MAIGVVTDLGIMESSTWLLAPNILPQMKMLTMPVTVATRMPLIITGRFSFIMRLLLYSGRAEQKVDKACACFVVLVSNIRLLKINKGNYHRARQYKRWNNAQFKLIYNNFAYYINNYGKSNAKQRRLDESFW